MIPISSWIPDVAAQVPGCPNPVITRYLIKVLRDFCQKTLLWDENLLTPIDVVALTADYPLSSDDGDIVHVDSVEIDGHPIWPISKANLNRLQIDWRDTTQTRPGAYHFGASNTLSLIYTPSQAYTAGLKVWTCLKPLETATEVEDFLWDSYRETILKGTVGKLAQIANMPWTDFALGMKKEGQFESERDAARVIKETGRTNMEMQTGGEFFC